MLKSKYLMKEQVDLFSKTLLKKKSLLVLWKSTKTTLVPTQSFCQKVTSARTTLIAR